ncbi:MAG: HAMP domain-containing sensor histidine kinase [Acinetobacter sp.]|nr:HAMP domain-containing sensor histidine kinase [Acinetobacter sp.]
MNLKKLQLKEMEQLSACRFPLLLGVMSAQADNKILAFIQFTAKILQAKQALLIFNDDPYAWYYTQQEQTSLQGTLQSELMAIDQKQLHPALSQFYSSIQLDGQHAHYQDVLQQLRQYGDYQRVIGFELQQHQNIQQAVQQPHKAHFNRSFGQVLFFDEQNTPFCDLQKELALEHCLNFVPYLELKYHHAMLQEQYEQQQALNASQTKFLSIISHDLRAPFHGLLGFSEVLATELDDLDRQGIQNIADYLYETSQSTYQLLESLLHWSMAEGGRFVYHPVQFKIKQIIQIVLQVLKPLALQKNIRLIDDVAQDLSVYADMNMMTSLLQNLVSNALKFTPTDGRGEIRISAQVIEQTLHLQVQDNGIGMTQEQLKHLFQPRMTFSFTGTAGEKGTGFGLALCQRFAHLNHGEIQVQSKEGKGSTFSVLLPTEKLPNK